MSGHETPIVIGSEPEQSEEQQVQERMANVRRRLVLVSGNGGVPLSGGQAICPVTVWDHLSLMSIAFFIGNKADVVIWHGPMKYKAIRPLLSDMDGGGLDYVVVDCPDVWRCITFCQQAGLPIPVDPRIVGCGDREEFLFDTDSQSLATQTYLAVALPDASNSLRLMASGTSKNGPACWTTSRNQWLAS